MAVERTQITAGSTREEIAQVLDISMRTVDNDWAMARMWLARELGRGHTSPPG